MNSPGLSAKELALLRTVFNRHTGLDCVKLFGSRAKGTHKPNSDIDLAISGQFSPLAAQTLAAELDELPLPYKFDIQLLDTIQSADLRAHIDRVGIAIYQR